MKKIRPLTLTLFTFFGGNYVFAQPVIVSFAPSSGPIGTIVTISGSNFNSIAANNIVFFGSVKANVSTATTTNLTVAVPLGATFQPISVTTNNLTAYTAQPFKVLFSSNILSLESFAPKVDSPTSLQPRQIAVSDFDGDGKTDIAVASHNSNVVSILRNTSSSEIVSFAQKLDFLTGVGPQSISIGDIDGDGKPDIAVTNSSTNTVSVLKNTSITGNISFASKLDFNGTVSSLSNNLSIVDIDGDGRPDIAMTNTAGKFSVLRNITSSGIISFATAVDFITGSNGSSAICIGDFNEDGKIDIAISNNTDTIISIFKNTSTPGLISFAPKQNYSTTSDPIYLCAVDLNNDGKLDIAVGSYLSNYISIFKNIGTGGNILFSPKIDYPSGRVQSITAEDIDGDGRTDLITPSFNTNTITVFKNTSTASNISLDTKLDFTSSTIPYGISIADFDMDGIPDMATTSFNSNKVSILRNKIAEVIQFCPGGSNNLVSNLSGNNYQWQVNTGSGFIDIADNSNYSGVHSKNLQLINIPSTWYGNQYRCSVDGINSIVLKIRFTNFWTGAVNNEWENPANWNCSAIPDNNTDVIVNNGNVILNSNTTIRSLILSKNAIFNINQNFILTITH